MMIRKISEERFCLVFNHQEDLRHALEMRPWTIDWNLRTLDVLRYIVSCLGQWEDKAHIDQDVSWLKVVCVRVLLNVTLPLKRALTLRSEAGDAPVIRFSYERLPNFCYLCGKLGHISRVCELRFQDDFVDPGQHPPYGPWLRASGQMRNVRASSPSSRPIYVWRTPSNGLYSRLSPSHGAFSRDSLRGPQIFGSFDRGAQRLDLRRCPLRLNQLKTLWSWRGGCVLRGRLWLEIKLVMGSWVVT
ncbi:hypothetical protein Salat_2544400 [Sesamum alatum]|uniref:CCHC-type domain-containing protein n=1 Tax=Sesamum alatum TaxID=300844 RepID=A0AAE1XSC1_9LAMI|nr:hypothetical protein Salat_2544400 [Sesamum alatum]